ncbi:MAG: VOC family protein [Candidatus Eremiobacteraeota bacterium]|nr:VOC family protein [Candidatus Eremiobacteraeota bacterium]
MVKEMAFVAYSVNDVPRSIAFYRDVVGLKPGELFGDSWAEFDVGGTAFGVGRGESLGIKAGSQFSAAFEVDDVKNMRDKLKAQDVEVTEIMEAGPCFVCFVTDPDGNRFALHQRKT